MYRTQLAFRPYRYKIAANGRGSFCHSQSLFFSQAICAGNNMNDRNSDVGDIFRSLFTYPKSRTEGLVQWKFCEKQTFCKKNKNKGLLKLVISQAKL